MYIEHIALNVADPVAVAEWYRQHLRLTIVRRVPGDTQTHFVADAKGRVVLEFYHQQAPVPDYAAMDPLVLHVAFGVSDMRGERQRLLLAGATAVGDVTVTPAGDELAMLRDPWGLAVQLVKRAEPLHPGET
jgi:glyoxylase I family protein